jgi:hypothetical protein
MNALLISIYFGIKLTNYEVCANTFEIFLKDGSSDGTTITTLCCCCLCD